MYISVSWGSLDPNNDKKNVFFSAIPIIQSTLLVSK